MLRNGHSAVLSKQQTGGGGWAGNGGKNGGWTVRLARRQAAKTAAREHGGRRRGETTAAKRPGQRRRTNTTIARKRTPSRYSTPPYIHAHVHVHVLVPITARARAAATCGEQLASIPLVEGRRALRNRSTLKQGCGGCGDRSEFENRTAVIFTPQATFTREVPTRTAERGGSRGRGSRGDRGAGARRGQRRWGEAAEAA